MVIFLQWYTMMLVERQRDEIRIEKQNSLVQSVKILDDYLLQSEAINATMQSNSFLIRMLQNQYAQSSEEVYSYLTNIMPTITGLAASHTMVDEIFVYRYMDSALSLSDMVYYIADINDFGYGDEYLEKLKTQDFIWFAVMDPNEARHRLSREETDSKLICLSKIYNPSYSQVIGVLEVQVNLNRIVNAMSGFVDGESLFLHTDDGMYYKVAFDGPANVNYEDALQSIGEIVENKNRVSTNLERLDLDFMFEYSENIGLDSNQIVGRSILTAIMLLIVPTLLFLLYLYRFTGKLGRFSDHIKLSHKKGLTQYEENSSKDEFGVMVDEYNLMTENITYLIKSVYRMERQKNRANYYAMQSQVNPHFLFNTLENIRSYIQMEQYDGIDDMLYALSRLIRYNISLKRESTLLKEINHIKNYLLIYQYRLKNKITYKIDVPEKFEDVECPFCILQPIVENCFKHGIKNIDESISIEIAISNEKEGVIVEVRDNGAGMNDEKLKEVNDMLAENADEENEEEYGSVGIKNVNTRIKFYYGDQYGISFKHNFPKGSVCIMHLGGKPSFDPQWLNLGINYENENQHED